MGDGTRLSQDISDLLDRVVDYPAGFSLLCRGNLECVAVLFGVSPQLIDEARALLRDPASRSAIAAALVSSRHVHGHHGRHELPPPKPAAAAPHAAKGVDELLRDAEACPGGVEVLLEAPLETAAILFGAHVFVVQQAREKLQGRVPNGGDEQTG